MKGNMEINQSACEDKAMNSRERVVRLIEGKPVDRPPVMPITMMWSADLIGANYHDYATRAEIQAAGQTAAAGRFGFDHVSVISDPCCEAADLGADIFYPPDGPPAIIEENALLADPATWRRLRVPDPHRAGSRMANRLEAVRLLRRQLGDTHLIEGWVEGPCAESADLRGLSALMMDYYDAPDFIHALAEFTVNVALKFARAQIEAGADLIGVGDAAASLISRELYDKFVLPHEKRLVEGIHAAGGRVRLHICGLTLHLADAMATLGCEIVDLDTMVDLGAARAAMGNRQVLLGNVHTVNVVKNGTPEDVRQALAKCRAAAGPAWIAGAGCEVPRHSPAENVRCFAQVV
jgi:MtaA/CmuA family methyltransferase